MHNLAAGQPDGDRGRRLGGKARVRRLAGAPVDDSGRTHAQYWGFLTWVRRGLIYVGDAKPVQGRWDLLGEILAAVTVGGDDADNADDDRG